jgi:hypothetical protein
MNKVVTARIRPDGTVVEILDDETERPFPKTPMPMPPMTEAEIEAAAAADPDARPMTPEEMAKARPDSVSVNSAMNETAGRHGPKSLAARRERPLARGFDPGSHNPRACAPLVNPRQSVVALAAFFHGGANE